MTRHLVSGARPGGNTLADLHAVIQTAMGGQDAHQYQFRVGDSCYGPRGTDLDLIPEDGVRLDQIIATEADPGTQTVLDYLYVVGDDRETSGERGDGDHC